MKIAFVFKYENNVGGGHFWRCYNLANNLKKKNRKFYFFSNSISNRYLNFLKKEKYKHIVISNNSRKNFKIQLFNKIKKLKIKNLITDTYDLNYKDKKILKNFVTKLIVIDDHVDKKHYCDVLINNNFLSVSSAKKIKSLNPKTQLLLGHKYLILNKKINNFKKKIIKKKKIKKIFIFFGTSDRTLETLKILKIVNFFLKNYFYIIVGNLNKNYKKIIRVCKNMNNVKVYYNLSNNKIIDLLKDSDLAIGSGGINLIERISLGVPSMVICVANNQKDASLFLNKKKIIYYLGESKSVSPQTIKNALHTLIKNKKKYNFLYSNTFKAFKGLKNNNFIEKKLNSTLLRQN